MDSSESMKIKKDLKEHLDRTAEIIRNHDGWNMVNMSEISERELLRVAEQHGLESDGQTRTFCKFISIGTNFASLDFKQRLQNIPVLVASVKELIMKMEQEIKEFSDIASFFHCLIQSFVKVVINTKVRLLIKFTKTCLETVKTTVLNLILTNRHLHNKL